MSQRPIILVTNDDDVTAPGIAMLVESVKHLGDVVVVAPDSPQSGMGHAITIAEPLRMEQVHLFGDIPTYQVSGTPADCVKLAVAKILHRKPDLVVSGINHGSNASINVIYSGTMSAAVEAAIESIPAIGFSLCNYSHDADMSVAGIYAGMIAEKVLSEGLPDGVLLNVNIPDVKKDKIKGVKICRQARAKYEEDFDERIDPYKRKYYWLVGKFIVSDQGEDTDTYALSQNYVSVVPVQFDLTAHHALSILNTWNLDVKR